MVLERGDFLLKNTKKIRYLAIISFSTILTIILHGITSGNSTVPKEANWSFFVENMGFLLTVVLYFLIAFSIIAYIFYRYEDKLPGTNRAKGLRYGIAISLLWLWGMLEGVSLFGNLLIDEFLTGVSDAIPIAVMGLLLGIFTTKKISSKITKKSFYSREIILSTFIFTTIFLAGRYFLYLANILPSGYQTNPYFTFIWTLSMGACIGVTYILLGQATQSSSIIFSAVKFGLTIFGPNWLAFVAFIPIIFKGTFITSIIRISIDTLLVILSYYLSESLAKIMNRRKKLA